MFFVRNRTPITTDTSNIKEDNVFVIKNVYRSPLHYIITGKCIRGNFKKDDKIAINEKGCSILEGYIEKIKTFDHIEINNTASDPDNNTSLYITIQDNDEKIKISNKHLVIK